MMSSAAVLILTLQCLLLVLFAFFAFFNYLYGFASLWTPRLPRRQGQWGKVAVVVVSYNERHVLEGTIRACEALTYPDKLIILGDDSDDPEIAERLRRQVKARGCRLASFPDRSGPAKGAGRGKQPEIWESPEFVFVHRDGNVGFKSGSVRVIHEYLSSRGIQYMYLLDADWHPAPDALERALEVLEADESAAFVQTKRLSFPKGMNLFQRLVSLVEEGCYHVDFEGRQRLGHPILFSGCCTLFRLDPVRDVGGFTPGHLTEDLDLTDRLWLAGWKGLYAGHIVNYGEVPFSYDHFRRQQERWAAGSARCLREFLWPILRSPRLTLGQKLSAVRQNSYFTTTLLTSIAILSGMLTVVWLVAGWNSYPVECYLYLLGLMKSPLTAALYLCILSNFVEPLIMVLVKTRRYRDLLHLPMMVWYAWSVLYTYLLGNLKGLLGIRLGWFRTPKLPRGKVGRLSRAPWAVRAVNAAICSAFICLYSAEGFVFGWFDEFALLLLPAFLLASIE